MSTKISSNVQNAFREIFGDRVKFDEPLAPYVAYRIGGPADILVFPSTDTELEWVSEQSRKLGLPITIIGNGTNLLVRDEGIRGITVSLFDAFKHIRMVLRNKEAVWVECGGGTGKPDLLEWAIGQGLSGLEFSAGVPGTIGGGIFMNAGTKYGCYGDILQELHLFSFEEGFRVVPRKDLKFGYREQDAVKNSLVTQVIFELRYGDKSAIRQEVDRIIAERAEKQPLDYPSCGSTFKNPPGHSAGRLIERAGLKGLARGNAEISTKHANFILNKGNASAADILDLIEIAKESVLRQFGVQLECEVIVLG